MRPDIIENSKIQSLIDYNLISILDAKHKLVILSNKINWIDINKELSAYYSNKKRKQKEAYKANGWASNIKTCLCTVR